MNSQDPNEAQVKPLFENLHALRANQQLAIAKGKKKEQPLINLDGNDNESEYSSYWSSSDMTENQRVYFLYLL
jgi:hypothetical protein